MPTLALRRWRSSKDSNGRIIGQGSLLDSFLERKTDEYEYKFMDFTEKMDFSGDRDSGDGGGVVGVPAGETVYQSEGE
jgi:hypothetical protein